MFDFPAFICAAIPILWLFISLCILRFPGHLSCPIALLLSVTAAVFFRNMSAAEAGSAVLEGVLFGLWQIVFVILAALILYKYSLFTGGMETIKNMLTRVSADSRVLVLILAWGLGGFLEGVAGFGTPVIIPGGILISLGFSPLFSVIACLVANSAPTAYATVGVPLLTLSGVTGLDPGRLSFVTAVQLFLLCLIVPFFLVVATGKSLYAVKGVLGITLISGFAFALPLLFLSKYAGPELPTLIGSVCAMVATVVGNKAFYRDNEHNRRYRIGRKDENAESVVSDLSAALRRSDAPLYSLGVFQSCLPFLVVLLTVLCTSSLVPIVHDPLSLLKSTVRVYAGENADSLNFFWLLTPGMLILLSTILTCVIQKRKLSELLRIIKASVRESVNPIITVLSIVATAKVMNYSGMTDSIALMLIAVFGSAYPLAAPVIGALGTFITGSDTACCILFGKLQLGAAEAIGANRFWITAANLSGATAGKMISPQSIAIAVTTAGLTGKDGEILRGSLKYCAIYLVILCALVYTNPFASFLL
jgi:lactate permease